MNRTKERIYMIAQKANSCDNKFYLFVKKNGKVQAIPTTEKINVIVPFLELLGYDFDNIYLLDAYKCKDYKELQHGIYELYKTSPHEYFYNALELKRVSI